MELGATLPNHIPARRSEVFGPKICLDSKNFLPTILFDLKYFWTQNSVEQNYFLPLHLEGHKILYTKYFETNNFFVHIGVGIICYKLIIYIILLLPFAIKLAGSLLDEPLFY